MQNLTGYRPLSVRQDHTLGFVLIGAVYQETTDLGPTWYVNCYSPITNNLYPHVLVLGPTPQVGQRGILLHVEGDPGTIAVMAFDAPAGEGYIPLWQGYTTTSTIPPGIAPYPFPGSQSTLWWVEVVGSGTGSITVGPTTVALPSTYGRVRAPLQPPPASGTALMPTLQASGSVTLGGIFLVWSLR
jgi:hypothetical protein